MANLNEKIVLDLLIRAWKNGHADALLRPDRSEAQEERRAHQVALEFLQEAYPSKGKGLPSEIVILRALHHQTLEELRVANEKVKEAARIAKINSKTEQSLVHLAEQRKLQVMELEATLERTREALVTAILRDADD